MSTGSWVFAVRGGLPSIFNLFRSASLILWAGTVGLPTGLAATRPHAAEVQINLCSTPEQAAKALRLHPISVERYEIWYFETADMALFRNGIVARLRIKGRSTELSLKFANQDCTRVAPALLPAHQSKCEYDVRGALAPGAVSISTALGDDQWRALLASPGNLQAMLSPAQTDFLRKEASAWPLPSPLVALGPARVQPYRRKGDKFVVESWQMPSGLQLLEISQKSKLSNTPDLNLELQARLTRNRVAICTDQGSPAGAKLRDLLGR